MDSNSEITDSENAKLLGIRFHCNVRWTEQVNHVITKARKRLFALQQLRKCGVVRCCLFVYIVLSFVMRFLHGVMSQQAYFRNLRNLNQGS